MQRPLPRPNEPPRTPSLAVRGLMLLHEPRFGPWLLLHEPRFGPWLRRLHRLFLDYPTEVLVEAVRSALAHHLLDLGRIERMTLQRVRGAFFRLPLDMSVAMKRRRAAWSRTCVFDVLATGFPDV